MVPTPEMDDTFMTRSALAATLALTLVSPFALIGQTSPAKAADPTFADATGRWSGKGWVKRKGDGDKEIVRCRITSSFEAPRLSIDGKCAASGTNFPVKGYIIDADGRFTGRWYNPVGNDTAPIRGKARGKTVALAFTFPPRENRKAVSGQLVWTKGSDELLLTSSDGAGELSRIVFRR